MCFSTKCCQCKLKGTVKHLAGENVHMQVRASVATLLVTQHILPVITELSERQQDHHIQTPQHTKRPVTQHNQAPSHKAAFRTASTCLLPNELPVSLMTSANCRGCQHINPEVAHACPRKCTVVPPKNCRLSKPTVGVTTEPDGVQPTTAAPDLLHLLPPPHWHTAVNPPHAQPCRPTYQLRPTIAPCPHTRLHIPISIQLAPSDGEVRQAHALRKHILAHAFTCQPPRPQQLPSQ
jgi:hypothetical protein